MIFGQPLALGRVLGAVSVSCLIITGMARADEALRDFTQPDLRDFTASAVIVQKNDAVLHKIGRSFAQGYRVRESLIRFKEPLKLRVDAKAGFLSVRYVLKQPIQVVGIWVPTRLEVYSADGHLAAVTRYASVKVNTGLSESLFRL